MLAQVKPENGKYLVQVYRVHEFLGKKNLADDCRV